MTNKIPFEALSETEARERLEVFVDRASDGGITDLQEYAWAMGEGESSLQHSIGSLVFHHGELVERPARHHDSYRLKQRDDGWTVHADMHVGTPEKNLLIHETTISSQRRRFGMWREQDVLMLLNYSPWEVMNIEKRRGLDECHIMRVYNPDIMRFIDESDDTKHQRFHSIDQYGNVTPTVSSAEMLATARADMPDALASFLRSSRRVVDQLLAATDRSAA